MENKDKKVSSSQPICFPFMEATRRHMLIGFRISRNLALKVGKI